MYIIKENTNSKITHKMYIDGIKINKLVKINIRCYGMISMSVFYVLLLQQKCLQLPLKFDAGITISNVNRQTVPQRRRCFGKVMSPYITVLVRGTIYKGFRHGCTYVCLMKLVNKALNNKIVLVLNTIYIFSSYNIIRVCYSINNFTKTPFVLYITSLNDI